MCEGAQKPEYHVKLCLGYAFCQIRYLRHDRMRFWTIERGVERKAGDYNGQSQDKDGQRRAVLALGDVENLMLMGKLSPPHASSARASPEVHTRPSSRRDPHLDRSCGMAKGLPSIALPEPRKTSARRRSVGLAPVVSLPHWTPPSFTLRARSCD